LYGKLQQKTTISGKAESTFNNYARCLAHLALYYKCSPEQLDVEQVEDYLYYLKKQHSTPSESFFKHTVYGLRYVYRMLGMDARRISLPQIERQKKLPVVMSAEEVRLMLKTPKYLKHRLILATLYDCGLRCFELRKVELRDVDFDRKMLHVREGKGRKDRYVPLSDHLIRGLKTYIKVDGPQGWLFNGQPDEEGKPTAYSQRGIQWIVKQTRKELGLEKPITTHTFRHSYATHLLENGLDLVSIKELLGHAHIETTMIYLYVAKSGRQKPFSPLDKLYPPKAE
jgi:site-specific recombinase XerD